MKFSSREDIDAPIEFVFERMTDFAMMERQAMRRGLEIKRKNPQHAEKLGAIWMLKAPFRGKIRNITMKVVEYDAPDRFGLSAVSGGLDMIVNVEFIPLSQSRTRIVAGLELTPNTLPARVLLQSVKFAKGRLNKRYKTRVQQIAAFMSNQYKAAQQG